MAKFEVAWEAPEYEYYEKGVSWYWISIIIAAVLVAFAVATRNFLFGVFIVIAELMLMVWANRPPTLLTFRMNGEGLSIGREKYYEWKEFESWSADTSEDEWVTLHFQFRSRFKFPLAIPLPREHFDAVRADLTAVPLKEVEFDPSLFENIERYIGF